MKHHSRLLLWCIIILTTLGVLIDLPPFPLPHVTIPLPLLNKSINLSNGYPGFGLNLIIGGNHIQRQFVFKEGLDLQGGTSITLRANMKDILAANRDTALQGVQTVLEKRVNLYGVSEPLIQTAVTNGNYRVDVELPGVGVQQAVQLIGTTAQLSFWEQTSASASASQIAQFPLGISQIFGYHARKTNLTGNDLQNAAVTFDSNTGQPQVQLTFSGNGSQKFADITKRDVGKVLAIALDNQVIEAPRINQPILTGNAVITGNFTSDSANQLVIALNAGALPVPLTILQQQSVGATLGTQALAKSLFAGFIGLFIVFLFMSVLYGRLGIIASFALVLYTIFVLAIFKIIPVTLTLAGIAGFILSIGMAVDANILIFERMKEELRSGKSDTLAIEQGFSRAWTSIRDSNVSTLITSAILYKFGTGIVRGFAFTLAIGVLVSMFSAIVVTRTFIRMFYK